MGTVVVGAINRKTGEDRSFEVWIPEGVSALSYVMKTLRGWNVISILDRASGTLLEFPEEAEW